MSASPRRPDIASAASYIGKVPILLQKSFWDGERKFLEPLMRFARADVRDRFIRNRSRASLVALKSEVAIEKSKYQLSRDFWCCSIFDFCNNIRPQRTSGKFEQLG
jgi:hypothetical protein